MNDTLKVIVSVLESGRPELQVAAAQILGELRAKDPSALKALALAVRRSPVLARFSFDALAKIGTPDALATIGNGLVDNDAVSDHAAHLLAEAGPAAHGVLANLYGTAPLEQRPRILAILARTLGKDGVPVFVQALLTPELTDHAARLLLGAADRFDATMQKLLRDGIGKHLDGPLPDRCLANVVTVLSRVDGAASRPLLVRFTGPTTAPEVRSAAFRALQGSKLGAAQVKSMMDLLEDVGQKDVHDAVREVLAQLPELPEGMVPICKRLLAARQPEQRLFALRMLRTAGGAELAKIALKLLDHADERFRAAAAESLAHNKHAVEPLVRLLQSTRDPEKAQVCATILGRLGSHLSPKLLRTCAEKAVKMLPTLTRNADLLFDVVLGVGGAKAAPMLVDYAVRLRRSKRLAEALHVLAKLAATPHGDDECRYQLALTKMLFDVARAAAPGSNGEVAQPGNATMGFFAALLRSGFPLAERLRKETAMTPETLLRIASHFADAVGPERRFATETLKHLAARTKGRAGEEARFALRAAGM
jgi:HEAT repeat protein